MRVRAVCIAAERVACATQRPVIGTDAPREIDAPLEYKYIYACHTRNLREIVHSCEETE